MDLLKQFSTSEIFAQIVGFLLLLFLLRAFAWKKLLKLLDDRRERIASEFKKIEATQAEIAKLRAEYDKKLSDIDETSRTKIQEAMARAKQLAEEVRESSQHQARKILEKAEESIGIELAKAKEELKNKVIDLTINTTEKIIKEKLTEEKDRKLVSEFIEEIDKA
ncbi:MAG: F0F1 ATP synthase subunit B [Candidatus Omnitrophota bacterium]|nr:F0F1 ATP synthase subunit B [Candidatus Omnitrophota bacterium]